MDDQMLSLLDPGIVPINNQVISVNHNSERQTTRRSLDILPAEVWLIINDFLYSKRDLVSLSGVDKFLHSLLMFARAKGEAEAYGSNWSRNDPTMLHVALKRGWPLEDIERVAAGYVAGYMGFGVFLLETEKSICWQPPLHLAVQMNRIDVVDLILRSGVDINIRWGGHVFTPCPGRAHTKCKGRGPRYCKNALDIAREFKNSKIERYLLHQGIEDLGRDETIHSWMYPFFKERCSVHKDWWPVF